MEKADRLLLHYARQVLTEREWKVFKSRAGDIPLHGVDGLRRYIAERSIEAFAMLYFSDEFTLDLAPIHHRILADLQKIHDLQVNHQPGLRLARAIPRGHSKSTYYSRILPLHGFLYGWSPLTVLLGNNDDSARRLVDNIKKSIESNAAIIQDFPTIKGKYWANERIESSNGSVITSFGIGSGATRGISNANYRPSLVILDDIDDERSVRSAVELAHNKEWFDKTVLALGAVDNSTTYVVVGTIIRKTSLMQYILSSVEFDSIIEKRVKRWSIHPELWDEWRTIYLELARNNTQPQSADEDTYYQEHKQEMLEGTEVLWDRKDEYYYAMRYMLGKEQAFYSEMQNEPKDTTGAFGALKMINIDSIDRNDYVVLAALDPTIKGNTNNDLSAHVEILFNRSRKEMIVSYVDAKQRGYGETIAAVVNRIKTNGLYNGFWIETNAHGSMIADMLQERFDNDGIYQLANGVYNTIPKVERINALSEYIQRGQLLFSDALPETFYEELNSWPLSKHDDQLDALAIIVLELRKSGQIDLIETEQVWS